jgi:hypothetical protein
MEVAQPRPRVRWEQVGKRKGRGEGRGDWGEYEYRPAG